MGLVKREYQIVRKDREGYDAVRKPTAIEVAWAAGIYEGEGTCVKAGHGGKSFSVLIVQKDPELLYRIKDVFGGRLTLCKNGPKEDRNKFQAYHWVICGDRARVFLGCIYPFLTSRRKVQIESTSANDFLEYVDDLLRPNFGAEPYTVYESLWERVGQNIEAQKKRAAEHRRKIRRAYEAREDQKAKKREAQRRRRALAKQQKSNVVEMQKSA